MQKLCYQSSTRCSSYAEVKLFLVVPGHDPFDTLSLPCSSGSQSMSYTGKSLAGRASTADGHSATEAIHGFKSLPKIALNVQFYAGKSSGVGDTTPPVMG
jgi:hypothetical protein